MEYFKHFAKIHRSKIPRKWIIKNNREGILNLSRKF